MKLKKKLMTVGLIGLLTVGQCMSVFATSFGVGNPSSRKIVNGNTYNCKVTSDISATDSNYYLRAGASGMYTVRGSSTYTTSTYYMTSSNRTNSYKPAQVVYSGGTVSDGKVWLYGKSYGYYTYDKSTYTYITYNLGAFVTG